MVQQENQLLNKILDRFNILILLGNITDNIYIRWYSENDCVDKYF